MCEFESLLYLAKICKIKDIYLCTKCNNPKDEECNNCRHKYCRERHLVKCNYYCNKKICYECGYDERSCNDCKRYTFYCEQHMSQCNQCSRGICKFCTINDLCIRCRKYNLTIYKPIKKLYDIRVIIN